MSSTMRKTVYATTFVICCCCAGIAEAFSVPNKNEATIIPTSTSAPSLASSKSYVEIFDPSSNTNIVLLGCLHGSISSSEDVRFLMESATPTDAVVLELCDTRVEDLTRETVDEYTMDVFREDVADFWSFIEDTNQKKGPFVAAITFLLGMMSLLQTNLSGIRAGLEFAVALDIADSQGCEVVLADRRIDRTMERISKLPSVSLEMIQNNTIIKDSKLLSNAVLGDPSLPKDTQLSMPKVLVRNKQAVRDLARLLLPPLILASVFALTLGIAFDLPLYAEQDSVELLFDSMTLVDDTDRLPIVFQIISSLLSEIFVFAFGYTLVALPASKVIITERDSFLAKGIQNACREQEHEAVEDKDASSCKRIVAVLGLLHVNGVAKQLLDNGAIPMQSNCKRRDSKLKSQFS